MRDVTLIFPCPLDTISSPSSLLRFSLLHEPRRMAHVSLLRASTELTMSLLMAMARQIPAAVESLKGGVWDRKTFSAGVELHGKTVGVIGLVRRAGCRLMTNRYRSCFAVLHLALPIAFDSALAAFPCRPSRDTCRARSGRRWRAAARPWAWRPSGSTRW